jgi:propanol-preferring alcohol dehydrogenase
VKGRLKAARFHEKGPLRIEDVPTRKTGVDEIQVRIRASGICYSDLHAMDEVIPYSTVPITPGHEGAGVVEAVGANVHDFKVGDHVVLRYVMSCGACLPCFQGKDNLCKNLKFLGFDIDGTFSEYVSVPSRHAVKLPDPIPFEEGAIIGCAVVTPMHAMNIAEVKPGSSVAIFGLGGVGIHAVQMAKIFGATEIFAVDVLDPKLALAKTFGATHTINGSKEDAVARIQQLTDGGYVDFAFEFIGFPPTQTQAIKSVKRGGTAMIVGIPREPLNVDSKYLLTNQIQLRTSFDHTRPEIDAVIGLVQAKRLDLSRSITHRFTLDRVNEGIETLRKKVGDPVRVVMTQ